MSGFQELATAVTGALTARPTVPLALATLIQVDGSSYRQPGARLLVDAEGRVLAGAISGGCLEGDIALRAKEVCALGRGIRLRYDLRADLETIWGYGAACDGVAHILVEPLIDPSWLSRAEAIRADRCGGAVAVVLDREGGGRSCALLAGDVATGTWSPIGDASRLPFLPALSQVTRAAQRTGAAVLHEGLTDSEASEPGEWFVDPLVAPVALHIIGAGRGAEAFAGIARTLEWDVTVVDHRPSMLGSLRLTEGVTSHVVHADAPDAISTFLATQPHDGRTAFALLSHIFAVDVAWLAALLPQPVACVGVLGSRQRAHQLLGAVQQQFDSRGIALTEAMRHRLHAPIGLDLGGESPASIALASIAEIEAVVHGRPGGSLRERRSPIHGRTPTPATSPIRPAPLAHHE